MPIEDSIAQQCKKMISVSSPSKGDEKCSQQVKDNNHLIQTLASMATNFINPFNTGGGALAPRQAAEQLVCAKTLGEEQLTRVIG